MDDDDDIIVIDESICSPPSPMRRSAPLREIEILDEPGPSTSGGIPDKNIRLPSSEYSNFNKLLELEQLIARAKANSISRSPKVSLTENDNDDIAVMLQENIPVDDVLALQEEAVPLAEEPEVPVKKKRRKEPSEAKLQKEVRGNDINHARLCINLDAVVIFHYFSFFSC
ncbi:unnamed protein product [Cylicostephanus goldi]|uniref:Uncharacterized protein n=1 Tax=Cylicostephanus goldi TaxID=71465 RepID=A0A3P6R587_CYLGO|nr:unnamed protein product [Cylicostephanus goldi]